MAARHAKRGLCPCGSGRAFDACCGRFLPEGPMPFGADSPEALMRSRFTAFALMEERYLLETWTEEARPERIFEAGSPALKWFALEVLRSSASADGRRGTVDYVARARSPRGAVVLAEHARFVRGEDGRWRYEGGVETTPAALRRGEFSD